MPDSRAPVSVDHRLDLNLFRVLDAVYVHGGISAAGIDATPDA